MFVFLNVKSTNRMWFSVVCTLIENDTRHHSGQNVPGESNFNHVMTRIVVDKSTDHAKPHFDLFFYHNINARENVFFRARPEKGIACQTTN